MSVLVCGSVAFDNIMFFEEHFKNHILPDQIDILSVAFLVPKMRRQFGGCAGNIVYGTKLLEHNTYAMATVGQDFLPYAEWMDKHGISREYVTTVDGEYTACAFVITDKGGNQITAFHPGAMNHCDINSIPDDAGISLGLISPECKRGMIEHAQQFKSAGIPFIFDPGQGLPMFGEQELITFIDQSDWVTCNEYESKMLCERSGKSLAQIAQNLRALIVTHGGDGSQIYCNNEVIEIPIAVPRAVVDHTGCGDAYRAGLIYGITRKLDWKTTGHIAALMGAFKIECDGGQRYHFTLDEFWGRFKDAFGYLPDVSTDSN